jgi:hypothetical protein
MNRLLTVLFCLLGFVAAHAQGPDQRPLRLGLGLVGATYLGDLTTQGGGFNRFSPGASLSLQFASERLLSPQINAGFAKVVAQDRTLPAVEGVQPNTFVQTPFFFVDLRLKARFLRQTPFHPYLSAGIGMLGYTPKDADGNNLIDNLASRGEGETYGSMTAAFPLSTGMELEIHPQLGVGLEYTFRPSASDYLDNIGRLGPKAGKDQLHAIMLSLFVTFDTGGGSPAPVIRGRDRN